MAYAGLLQDRTPGTDRPFELSQIADIAQFAAKHWPQDSLAEDARFTLLKIAVNGDDLAEAAVLLGQISDASPRRCEAELLVGQSLWSAYVRASRLPKQKQPTTEKMAAMISSAEKMLTDAVKRMRKDLEAGQEVSATLAAAGTLLLAQICLEEDQGEKAIQWLDDPVIGAHTLVKAGNKAVDRGNFRVDTLKTALRAYVATERLDQATQAMDALEKAAPGENLTQTYMLLGRQLETAVKRLQSEGKPAEADRVARGFEVFLTRIANRPANEITFNALYWVAETFVELGNRLSPDDGELSSEAERYYRQAALVYGRIVDLCRTDKEFAPQEGMADAIKIRLARCLRRLGKYKDALDMLVEVLAKNRNLLDAQREAAYTYQAWGEKEPGYYVFAIRGGQKAKLPGGDVVYLVWGWAGIAQKVQDDDRYQDAFNEARYNLALCRMNYALSLSGKKQAAQLRQAEQDILLLQRLRPEMGGEKWYNKYDSLLKNIQTRLGVKENQRGLDASEKKMSGASK